MKKRRCRIDSFDLEPGCTIAGKYLVERKLGEGWEGEVYKVRERRTRVHRAAKLFYPQRNERNRAVSTYARKLERLRDCSIVIKYHHSETFNHDDVPVTCLISEFVEGKLLTTFLKEQRGGRLSPYEALHLAHALAHGLEQIHAHREYHGDLHANNVMVERKGIFFDVKLVDFYHWGPSNAGHMFDDVADAIRLLYDSVGGRKRYASQPDCIKDICKGLRKDLIRAAFPTAAHLREHLETFPWD